MPALKFDTAALSAGFHDSLSAVIAAETDLGAQALAELRALADSLFPLATGLAQELLNSANPLVQRQYLAGLGAIVEDKVAELAGGAILAHKALVARETMRWVLILATVLKAVLL